MFVMDLILSIFIISLIWNSISSSSYFFEKLIEHANATDEEDELHRMIGNVTNLMITTDKAQNLLRYSHDFLSRYKFHKIAKKLQLTFGGFPLNFLLHQAQI
jgi:hypothetical protein